MAHVTLDALQATLMHTIDPANYTGYSTTVGEFMWMFKHTGPRFFTVNYFSTQQSLWQILNRIRHGVSVPGNTSEGYKWAYRAVEGALYTSDTKKQQLLELINDKCQEEGFGEIHFSRQLLLLNCFKYIVTFLLIGISIWLFVSLASKTPNITTETVGRAVLFCSSVVVEVLGVLTQTRSSPYKLYRLSSELNTMLVALGFDTQSYIKDNTSPTTTPNPASTIAPDTTKSPVESGRRYSTLTSHPVTTSLLPATDLATFESFFTASIYPQTTLATTVRDTPIREVPSQVAKVTYYYMDHGNQRYYLVDRKTYATNSMHHCHELFKMLLFIKSEEEKQFVQKFAKSLGVSQFWIGFANPPYRFYPALFLVNSGTVKKATGVAALQDSCALLHLMLFKLCIEELIINILVYAERALRAVCVGC